MKRYSQNHAKSATEDPAAVADFAALQARPPKPRKRTGRPTARPSSRRPAAAQRPCRPGGRQDPRPGGRGAGAQRRPPTPESHLRDPSPSCIVHSARRPRGGRTDGRGGRRRLTKNNYGERRRLIIFFLTEVDAAKGAHRQPSRLPPAGLAGPVRAVRARRPRPRPARG